MAAVLPGSATLGDPRRSVRVQGLTKEAYDMAAALLCRFKKVWAVMELIGFRRTASDQYRWTLHTDESDEEFIKRCGG